MKKRLLSTLLALCMVLELLPGTAWAADEGASVRPASARTGAVWDGTAADSYAGGSGTAKDPYLIATAEQLARIANQVNSGAESGKNYQLLNDIYLNDISSADSWDIAAPQNQWTPIGSATAQFSGVFDGAGHIVFGLYISTADNYQGLFGSADKNSPVSNLGLEKSYIKGGDYVGGICGYSSSSFNNCHNKSTIIGNKYVSGIIGYAQNPGGWLGGSPVKIENCYNTGKISGDTYIGGILGSADTGVLKKCYNVGAVTGTSRVGGIAGRTVETHYCWNIGNVTGTDFIGGILGEGAFFGSDSTRILSCFNAGKVIGKSYVGGLFGYASQYSGLYPATVSDCYNVGQLTGDGDYIGGISGQGQVCKYTNCYNVGNCSLGDGEHTGAIFNVARKGSGNLYFLEGCCGSDYWNGWSPTVSAKSSAEMQESAFISTLNNGGTAWVQDANGYNSGYPILSGIDYTVYAQYVKNPDDIASNHYIIDRVKSYTSDELYAQYQHIVSGNYSEDVKFQWLIELFTANGLLDVREGVVYFSYAPEDRLHYLYLMDNSCFSAWQYYNWLHTTANGIAVKGLLWADGLIFNNEINTMLDPFTYTDMDNLPGVSKYKDMLYKFMDITSIEIEKKEYINFANKVSKNATNSGKVYADGLIKKINSCKDKDELRELMHSAAAQGLYMDVKTEGTDINTFKIKYELDKESGFGQFAKEAGFVTKAISLGDMTINHILDIMELSNKLTIYCQYQDFLHEIAHAADIPWELRRAAAGILEELDEGAWGEVLKIATSIFKELERPLADALDAKFVRQVFEQVLGEAKITVIKEWLMVINIESWCINNVVDIGALVKGVSFVEGYAYLGMHYAKKLEESKKAFLKNPTEENAWIFYDNYNLLYRLRCSGEQAVQSMHKLDGVMSLFTDFGYAEKKEAVDVILDYLSQCRFTLDENIEVPSSVKYATKSVVNCPVNVEVYAPSGEYITTLTDGVESDVTNEHGRFAVVYRVYSGDYAKVLCFNQDANYIIKVVGTDYGLVDFELAHNSDVYQFDHVEISSATVIQASIEQITNQHIYNIDLDGDKLYDEIGDVQVIGQYVPVTGIGLNTTALSLAEGETALLPVSIIPKNATIQNIIWLSDNVDVASIYNGKVVAKSVGTAKISCISQDNLDCVAICNITVTSSDYVTNYTITFDANGGTGSRYSLPATKEEIFILPICTFTPPSGKVFDKWAIGGADSSITAEAGRSYTFTADTTVYALWKDAPIPPTPPTPPTPPVTLYQITFDPNGGAEDRITLTTDTSGKLLALPTPTREGYTFDGWYTAPTGGEKVNADKVYRLDTTLYAHWIENALPPADVTYTITFDANGGSGTMSAVTLAEGEAFTLPVCTFTAPDGKEFKAWSIDGAEYASGTGYTVTSDTTVTAVWQDKQPVSPANYTITFSSNGETFTITATENVPLVLPACTFTVPDSKEFKAWNIDGKEYAPGTSHTFVADTTVTAVWQDTAPTPGHTHVWETAWSCDETHHWKECSTSECPITENINKSEYGEHTYDNENAAVCSTCEYKRAVTPPAPPRPTAGEETYYISIPRFTGGEIIPSTRYAEQGERVTLAAYPSKGYELEAITVTDVRGRALALRDSGNNRYSFIMPDTRVTVEASFVRIADNTPSAPAEDEPFTGLGTPGISGIVLNPAAMPFTDVRTGDWFYNSVDYVWKHYLMSGVSDTQFAPQSTTTRAMIWTILARMNNVSTEAGSGSAWYERGKLWAMEQGVTDGTNPLGDITREQLVTMLWRNAGSPVATADLSQFSDSSTVSGYALGAVNWAVANGILNGSGGKLNPKGTAARAQVAAMVMRYGERVGA